MDRLRHHVTWLGLTVLACGGNTNSDGAERSTGGAETGGSETATTGGAPSGGNTAGGSGGGGASAGGTSGGGASSGGTTSGGASSGGTTSGGASSGGTTSGGTNSGGSANTGGAGGATRSGGTSGSGASGGTATGGSAVGGSITSGAGPGGAAPGGTGGTHVGGTSGSAGASATCHVAVRIDACCSEPIAVESAAFGDPCVLPYRSYYSSSELAGCPAAEACLMVNCTHPAPPSRVVTRPSGECRFDDECITAAEPYSVCWVATDYNYCCSCPEVIPRVVVEADPCVLTEGLPEPGTCADCSAVDCAPCNTPEPSIFCEYDSVTELSVCRGRID